MYDIWSDIGLDFVSANLKEGPKVHLKLKKYQR